jgi:hypothetical protein
LKVTGSDAPPLDPQSATILLAPAARCTRTANLELWTGSGLVKGAPLSLKDTLSHFVVPVTFWVHDHVSPPRVVKVVVAAGVGDDPPVDAVPEVHAAVITAMSASAPT